MVSATSLMTLGKSYLDCARYLKDGFDSKALKLHYDKPIDFLFAHSAELMLKGCIVHDEPNFDVSSLGHRLSSLYEKACAGEFGQRVINAAETEIQTKWRRHLITNQNNFRENLCIPSELESHCGVQSDSDIEAALCQLKLQNALEWLKYYRNIDRNYIRYPMNAIYKRPQVDPYKSSDDVIRKTVIWGCSHIYSIFSPLRQK